MKAFFTTCIISTLCVAAIPTIAATRSSSYLPAKNFCAVYRGSINSEQKFVLLVEQEQQLTIQSDSNLRVAVTRQGKIVPPYQVDSPNDTLISERSYRTPLMGKHIIWVRGSTSEATIKLCLQ